MLAGTSWTDDLLSPGGLAVVLGVGVVILGIVYFGVRYWLASTRPAAIRDIPTPNLDRLNREALERMSGEEEEEEEEEEAPEGLKEVVPEEGKSGGERDEKG